MLNNDTIVDPRMLNQLLEAGQADARSRYPRAQVLYYDDPEVVWSAGRRALSSGSRQHRTRIALTGLDETTSTWNTPSAAVLLIHRRAFEQSRPVRPGAFLLRRLGLFHRVRTHGLHIRFVPDARMWHKVSKSTREPSKQLLFWRVWGESSTRYYRRHGRPVFISLPVHVGYLMARELVKGNGKYLKHFWAGVREGLSKPLGPFPTQDDMILPPAPTEQA
jgi:GT2 family glycosyltransferase